MIGEVEFTVSTKRGSFQWKGYGLRLDVSKDSLPPAECRIHIRVSFSGQFQLPESVLLSPVFWISISCKFTKPVTLEIQHCAPTEDEAALSNLSFVFTKCSQKDLPYRFTTTGGRWCVHQTQHIWEHPAEPILVRFQHSEITLDISEDGLVTTEGWRITPFTTPTVS